MSAPRIDRLSEGLDEIECRVGNIGPAVIDREGVATVRHLHDLRHGPVAPLPLVRTFAVAHGTMWSFSPSMISSGSSGQSGQALSRLCHPDAHLRIQGSASRGRPAHQLGPHPAVTYDGWLWDMRRLPRAPLAPSAPLWSGATVSLPNFWTRGGRAARWPWCTDGPGSARAAWSRSSRTGSGTREGLSWLAGAARPPGMCRSVRCGRPCLVPPVSGWRRRHD